MNLENSLLISTEGLRDCLKTLSILQDKKEKSLALCCGTNL